MNQPFEIKVNTLVENRPLGRPPKQRDQRQRILFQTAKIIATVGYEQCSLADIASELDLTRPALYHYFPTKQRIFTEIAMTAVKGTFEHVSAGIDRGLSSTNQLQTLMCRHAEHFDNNYWLVNATIAAYGGISRRELERLDEFEAYRRKYEKLANEVIRSGINNKEFRSVNVEETTRSIFQLLNITRWYRPGGARTAVDVALSNFELIIGGLATPSNAEA